VNGEIVTLSEFERRQVAALRERPELAQLPPSSPRLSQAIAESAPALILGAVDELLLLQRARENGWTLTDERYREILDNIRTTNSLESDEVFRKALQSEGMTEAMLRTTIERDLLIRQVQQVEVLEKIDVTEGELKAYYETHRSEFTTPSEVMLREILIGVPTTDRGINVAEDEAARARAEEVRKRLLAGEPFPRLAAEVSASTSKANGGLIGPVRLQDLAPALQAVLTPMSPGEMTEVVPTMSGYHIFRLESRSDTKVRSLEDARGDVSRRVAEQRSQGEIAKYLEKLRAQAKITWRHEELRKAYERALAERRVEMGLSPPAPPAL
jgi:parvulin-like peptidyl-prolyl isomerase